VVVVAAAAAVTVVVVEGKQRFWRLVERIEYLLLLEIFGCWKVVG
jgi:hypothetical protein